MPSRLLKITKSIFETATKSNKNVMKTNYCVVLILADNKLCIQVIL